MKTNTKEKTCPECNLPIVGRADKVFCSDMCRNQHNNKINSDTTNLMRNINNALRRNRRILESVVHEDRNKSTISKLRQRGFDFKYYTHTQESKNGQTQVYCYDLGYVKCNEEELLLLRTKQEC